MLAITDIREALPQQPAGYEDARFLDGFSLAKNPDMWNKDKLEHSPCVMQWQPPTGR
jgi:tRNA U34 5-methylaminomethyl-2-thiouridine-forming methyltransferase MnmC